MQQTTSREFSIIESSDPFLPEALNDNTRKIEAALDAHETQTKAVTDALAARITTMEGHKMVMGTYTGDGVNNRVIPLPFTPTLVITHSLSYHSTLVATPDCDSNCYVQVVEGGFKLRYMKGMIDEPNAGGKYVYIAYR